MSCFTSTVNKNNDFYDFNYGLDSIDYVNQLIKSILYPRPNTSHEEIKKLNKLPNTNIFYITNPKLKIKTCVCEIYPINHPNSNNKILIFSHGNGCDILTFYPYLKFLADNLGIKVISYDYPTYGLSQGELDEFTCYQSLTDVINHYSKINPNILLVGQSLGTGIVIDYISKNVWSNPVILISPYKSIPKVITQFDFIEYLICRNKFDSYNKISNTKCPIKIYHGKSDNVIDVSHGLELNKLVPNKKFKITLFENTSHNDILNKIKLEDYNLILKYI